MKDLKDLGVNELSNEDVHSIVGGSWLSYGAGWVYGKMELAYEAAKEKIAEAMDKLNTRVQEWAATSE